MGKAHFELRLLPVNGDGESPPIATFQARTTLGLWMLVPDALGFSYLEHMAALARVAPGNPGVDLVMLNGQQTAIQWQARLIYREDG